MTTRLTRAQVARLGSTIPTTLTDLSRVPTFGICGDAFACEHDRAIARHFGLESAYLEEANRRAPADERDY